MTLPDAETGSPIRVAARRLRRNWLRLLLFVVAVAGATTFVRWAESSGHLDPERLVAFLDSFRANPLAPLLLVLLYLLLCPLGVPITPLVLAGGAVFGTWPGALLNFAGTLLGGTVTFLLARLLGQDFVFELLGDRRQALRRLVRQHGLWAMVRLRFVPIPFAVANLAAALFGVRLATFVASTAIAFAPAMVVYTYFASSLVTVAEGERSGVVRNLLIAALLLLALTFVPTGVRRWRRVKRLRQLLELRRGRRRTTVGGVK